MNSNASQFKLLICDLDNTLYDWVAYFVPSFYAMVDVAVRILRCDREQLLDDFREVHQRHHDSEHPFALLETRTVLNLFEGLDRGETIKRLDPAFHAFNSARLKHLNLNPGVNSTLRYIQQRGIKIVAHTDSQLFGVVDRLTRLNLTEYFSKIYCRERPSQSHPDYENNWSRLNNFPIEKVRELSRHQLKPDPDILYEICNAESIGPNEAVYVGDSIARDIHMARKSEVYSIWAKYGAILNSDDYERLVRVTHWTTEDVEKERRLKKEAEGIKPNFIADHSFVEILSAIFPDEGRAVRL
jgi:phosphoglycolate phosphatase